MKKNKVSVIVPIYGVEKYLPECLDSIINQTYTNLEIILVDDKSPDKSGKIADDYAERDKRIKVIHKPKNEGLNMARATGFKKSSGDFVAFIDSDDKVLPNYVEKLLQTQTNTAADIAMRGYIPYDHKLEHPLMDYNPNIHHPVKLKPDVYTKEQAIYYYLTQFTYWQHNNNPTNTQCKLFKREILNAVNWEDCNYSIGEDDFETIYTFSKAEKYAVINDQLYLYRINPDSISNSNKIIPKHQGRQISAFELCGDFEEKAFKLLGERYRNEIYYRTYTLYQYYIGILLKKGGLSSNDILVFDKRFPLKEVKQVKGHPIDRDVLFLIEAGGLARYITSLLNTERIRVGDLEHTVSKKNDELVAIRGELSSFLGIKRSAKLLLGNIKRRLKSYMP